MDDKDLFEPKYFSTFTVIIVAVFAAVAGINLRTLVGKNVIDLYYYRGICAFYEIGFSVSVVMIMSLLIFTKRDYLMLIATVFYSAFRIMLLYDSLTYRKYFIDPSGMKVYVIIACFGAAFLSVYMLILFVNVSL